MKTQRVYVASSISNIDWVRRVQQMIKDGGREITYDWTTHGDVTSLGDDRMREVATREIFAVKSADVLIVLLPGGKGTYWEMGIASALEKPIIVIGDSNSVARTDSAFYHSPTVVWYNAANPQTYPSAISQILFDALNTLEVM